MTNVYSINQIDEQQIRRISTGIYDLDELIGNSCLERKFIGKSRFYEEAHIERGLPRGFISLWSGEAGVGKSRIITQIAKNVNAEGNCVLVFPGEMPLSEYKNYIKNVRFPNTYYVSNSDILSEQLDIIENVRHNHQSPFYPNLIIIDSINMLEDFNSSTGIREIMNTYKTKAYQTNAHIAFIAHQNKEGDVKGNTDLSHLVDNVFMLNKYEPPKFVIVNGKRVRTDELKLDKKTQDEIRSIFCIEVGKNRAGKSGGKLYFKHTDNGVEECGHNINIIVPTVVQENNIVTQREPIVGIDVNLQGKPMNFFDRLFFKNFGG